MSVAGAADFGARCVAVISESAQIFPEDRINEGIRAALPALVPGRPQYERLKKYHGEKTDWVLSSWIDNWLDRLYARSYGSYEEGTLPCARPSRRSGRVRQHRAGQAPVRSCRGPCSASCHERLRPRAAPGSAGGNPGNGGRVLSLERETIKPFAETQPRLFGEGRGIALGIGAQRLYMGALCLGDFTAWPTNHFSKSGRGPRGDIGTRGRSFPN